MEDNINENKKGVENEPGDLENREESLESVLGSNRKKETEAIEKFDDMDNEIEKKIPEAFGSGAGSEKKKIIDKEEMVKKEASEIKEEYDQAIDEITGKEADLTVKEDNMNLTEDGNKESKYNRIVSIEELGEFNRKIEEKIKERAKELGISEQKLIDIAELDLESLDPVKLDKLNLKQGELNFIEESITESINQFEKSNDPGKLFKESPTNVDEIVEFANEHNKTVGVGMLLLYLSSFGVSAMDALAKADASVDVYGEKVSIKDLMDNPKLMKDIEMANNFNSPIWIKAVYEPYGAFEHGDNVKFSFSVNAKIDNNNKMKMSVYIGDILGPIEGLDNMNKELENIGISLVGGKESAVDDFINKKDQIAQIMSKNLGVPLENVSKYINEYIEPEIDVSDVKIVELEDFKITKEEEKKPILEQKKMEIYEKYKVDDENGRNPDSWLKAEKELEAWWKNNGNSSISFDKALEEEKKEIKNSPESKLKRLKYHEKETSMFKNADEFRNLTIKSLKEAGYSIEDLKKIAEDNPEEVIKIMADVINENVDYDWLEYLNLEVNELISKLIGEKFQINYFMDKKHEEGISKETLKSGKGVCHDIGETFVAMKYVLEKEGVPNLDKFVSLWTVSSALNHLWPVLVTIEHDKTNESKVKLVISYIDPTWSDSDKSKLDANDEKHYYTLNREDIDAAQKEILEAINNYNKFVRQERIREELMMYNPDMKKIGMQYVETKK